MYGPVYGQPWKKIGRLTRKCARIVKSCLLFYSKINKFIGKFIARSMVVSTDSVVFKLLERYRRANQTYQGKIACLYGALVISDEGPFFETMKLVALFR